MQCVLQSPVTSVVGRPRAGGRAGRTPVSALRSGHLAGLRRRLIKARAAAEAEAGEEVAADPATAVPAASVTLRVAKSVAFGQVLKAVGVPPELGGWDSAAAPALEWSEGDQWQLTVPLAAGSHEFKLVVASPDGAVDWEEGPNRTLEVPADAAASGALLVVAAQWGATQAPLMEVPPAEPEAPAAEAAAPAEEEPAPAGAAEPEFPAAEPAAEPVVEQGDDSHAAVPPVPADNPSGTPMTEGSLREAHGWVDGGLSPAEEAEVKKELQKLAAAEAKQHEAAISPAPEPPAPAAEAAAPASSPFTSFLQALGILPAGSSKEGDDDEGGSGSPGGGGAGSTGHQAGGGGAPPSAGGGSFSALAAALGLAALPVVAWSEWTLHATGCGLPPGPSGLLGAAEGVSYLTVGGLVLWSLVSTPSPTAASGGGALRLAVGGSWLATAIGVGVLALQYQNYGYIPSALPDSRCFGGPAAVAATTEAAPSRSLELPLLSLELVSAPALAGGSSGATAASGSSSDTAVPVAFSGSSDGTAVEIDSRKVTSSYSGTLHFN